MVLTGLSRLCDWSVGLWLVPEVTDGTGHVHTGSHHLKRQHNRAKQCSRTRVKGNGRSVECHTCFLVDSMCRRVLLFVLQATWGRSPELWAAAGSWWVCVSMRNGGPGLGHEGLKNTQAHFCHTIPLFHECLCIAGLFAQLPQAQIGRKLCFIVNTHRRPKKDLKDGHCRGWTANASPRRRPGVIQNRWPSPLSSTPWEGAAVFLQAPARSPMSSLPRSLGSSSPATLRREKGL